LARLIEVFVALAAFGFEVPALELAIVPVFVVVVKRGFW
jgi:hypothetical protein